MKYLFLIGLIVLAGCGPSPLEVQNQKNIAQNRCWDACRDAAWTGGVCHFDVCVCWQACFPDAVRPTACGTPEALERYPRCPAGTRQATATGLLLEWKPVDCALLEDSPDCTCHDANPDFVTCDSSSSNPSR